MSTIADTIEETLIKADEKPQFCGNVKCQKPLIHVEGKRAKKYCNDYCKITQARYENRQQPKDYKPKKYKLVPLQTYDLLVNKKVSSKVDTTKTFKPPKDRITIEAYQEKLAEIQGRVKPPIFTEANWKEMIEGEIQKLKQQL